MYQVVTLSSLYSDKTRQIDVSLKRLRAHELINIFRQREGPS